MKVNYLTLLAGATLVLLSAAAARAEESAATALAADANAAPAGPGDNGKHRARGAPRRRATPPPITKTPIRCGISLPAPGPGQCIPRARRPRSASTRSRAVLALLRRRRHLEQRRPQPGLQPPRQRQRYRRRAGCTTSARSVEADIDYRALPAPVVLQDSYAGWTTVSQLPRTAATPANSEQLSCSRNNLSPGQDYAIRVQEFKANFKGNLTDNLKWYVNTFGIDKEASGRSIPWACASTPTTPGTRPTTASTTPPLTTQPATRNADQCHVVSQAQHIDWQTTEVEPGLELRLGATDRRIIRT